MPARVEPLYKCYWQNGKVRVWVCIGQVHTWIYFDCDVGCVFRAASHSQLVCLQVCQDLPDMNDIRNLAMTSLKQLRTDHKRALNPTPYKVRVTYDRNVHRCSPSPHIVHALIQY